MSDDGTTPELVPTADNPLPPGAVEVPAMGALWRVRHADLQTVRTRSVEDDSGEVVAQVLTFRNGATGILRPQPDGTALLSVTSQDGTTRVFSVAKNGTATETTPAPARVTAPSGEGDGEGAGEPGSGAGTGGTHTGNGATHNGQDIPGHF